MGFFSQECARCTKSTLSEMAVTETNAWMNQIVVLTPNGSILRGSYDGYGRIETGSTSYEDAVGFDNEVYHEACWELAGKPTTFTKASPYAHDQGWFYDDDDGYEIPDPRSTQ